MRANGRPKIDEILPTSGILYKEVIGSGRRQYFHGLDLRGSNHKGRQVHVGDVVVLDCPESDDSIPMPPEPPNRVARPWYPLENPWKVGLILALWSYQESAESEEKYEMSIAWLHRYYHVTKHKEALRNQVKELMHINLNKFLLIESDDVQDGVSAERIIPDKWCVPKATVVAEETPAVDNGKEEAGNTSCYEEAPFDCPEDTYCTSWNDGCNECGCGSPDGAAFCSMMMCPCYDDNSCVPTCNDNDQCVPKATGTASAASDETPDVDNDEDEEPLPTHPFDCAAGSTCTEWTDGCNNCRAAGADNALAACTEKYCPCYDDDSCVPVCFDNALCVPATVLLSSNGVASFVVDWLPVLLVPAVALGL
ncbi:expressed unknown protein [Seminavis robusta]|uniref:Uncharacterized protein n=1 Tax=Seminavis robusta TaxID=568900 RepID=A0A9N8HFU5_9STRA|nr:expressed unknown protein [Seminavis robusta]|eukprot:Sro366_g127500.1 n/a (366) ;mRNA; f:940-2111